jgi:hypothetical protein
MMDAYEFTNREGIVKEEDYPHKYGAREQKCADVSKLQKVYNLGAVEEDSISVERLK